MSQVTGHRSQVTGLIAAGLIVCPVLASASVLFTEDFEDGSLDSRISVSTVGGFNSQPGIKNLSNFGSTKAFGFGLSSCSVNCFSNYLTLFTIDFGSPTFVSTLSFNEMELYDNWGSNGEVYLDGVALSPAHSDFGRLPYNDRRADATFRQHNFAIGTPVTRLELIVYDITRLSEIYIDDVVVSGSPVSAIPEPATALSLLIGLLGIFATGKGYRAK